MPIVTGASNDDLLMGTAVADSISGLGGSDTLEGGLGADQLNGGSGNDTASYAGASTGVKASLAVPSSNTGEAAGDTYSSIENLTGSAFDDALAGNDSANVLTGGKGADVLNGFGGIDTASYGNAQTGVAASLAAPSGNTGEAAGDSYLSIENLSGSAFDDVLTGSNPTAFGSGANRLSGLDGNDMLQGLGGADVLDGGMGSDTATYAGAATGVVASLASPAANTGDAAGDSYVSIENLTGSAFADALTGNNAANVLTGGAGADALNGMGGNDTAAYGNAASGVAASLTTPGSNTGDAAGDSYLSIENLSGSAFNDTLVGDAGANALFGLQGDDILQGRAGADLLSGKDGNDTASYSAASGAVVASLIAPGTNTGEAAGDSYDSIENLTGSAFDDTLTGTNPSVSGAGVNILSGLAGNDTLQGRGGADVLDGGAGKDAASYADATGAVYASLATPALNFGEAAGDSYVAIEDLIGSAFNDVLVGDGGANKLSGLGGDDILESHGGGSTSFYSFSYEILDGGDGNDTATYANATSAVTAFLAIWGFPFGVGDANADAYYSIENLTGTAFADTLGGDDGANKLNGLAGDDILAGGDGGDAFNGGTGNDTVDYALLLPLTSTAGVVASLTTPASNTGEAAGDSYVSIENLTGTYGNDTLTGNGGANRLYSLNGDDFLNGMGGDDILRGGVGLDTFDGGTGSDTVDYSWLGYGVTRDLAVTGWQGWDRFVSIENLTGSAAADTLIGEGGVNKLMGMGGDDVLQGRLGADVLNGGTGRDTASYIGGLSSISASLANPTLNDGEATGDIYISIENLTGSRLFGDWLEGNNADNVLMGAGEDDILRGNGGSDTASYANAFTGVVASLATPASNTGDAAGDSYYSIENLAGSDFADLLTGDGGKNQISGGKGADILSGLTGKDTLVGGDGADQFLFTALGDSTFNAPDLIADFQMIDKIDLHLIDADTTLAGDQAFHLDGTFGGAGDIRVTYDSVNDRTVLDLFVNNNASVDSRILLTGYYGTIGAASFIL
jgi:Ca2+-binding RTX toxin-like protein